VDVELRLQRSRSRGGRKRSEPRKAGDLDDSREGRVTNEGGEAALMSRGEGRVLRGKTHKTLAKKVASKKGNMGRKENQPAQT